MTSIHKYSYMSNKTTKIQLKNLMNVAAVEYDYENDCVFFADNMFDNIQVWIYYLCKRSISPHIFTKIY